MQPALHQLLITQNFHLHRMCRMNCRSCHTKAVTETESLKSKLLRRGAREAPAAKSQNSVASMSISDEVPRTAIVIFVEPDSSGSKKPHAADRG